MVVQAGEREGGGEMQSRANMWRERRKAMTAKRMDVQFVREVYTMHARTAQRM